MAFERPKIPTVSTGTGDVSSSRFAFDESFWCSGAADAGTPAACARTLADQEVDVIVDVGPSKSVGEAIVGLWPASGGDAPAGPALEPLLLSGTELLRGDSEFVSAVARAYAAGLRVSFPGLFAGERETACCVADLSLRSGTPLGRTKETLTRSCGALRNDRRAERFVESLDALFYFGNPSTLGISPTRPIHFMRIL